MSSPLSVLDKSLWGWPAKRTAWNKELEKRYSPRPRDEISGLELALMSTHIILHVALEPGMKRPRSRDRSREREPGAELEEEEEPEPGVSHATSFKVNADRDSGEEVVTGLDFAAAAFKTGLAVLLDPKVKVMCEETKTGLLEAIQNWKARQEKTNESDLFKKLSRLSGRSWFGGKVLENLNRMHHSGPLPAVAKSESDVMVILSKATGPVAGTDTHDKVSWRSIDPIDGTMEYVAGGPFALEESHFTGSRYEWGVVANAKSHRKGCSPGDYHNDLQLRKDPANTYAVVYLCMKVDGEFKAWYRDSLPSEIPRIIHQEELEIEEDGQRPARGNPSSSRGGGPSQRDPSPRNSSPRNLTITDQHWHEIKYEPVRSLHKELRLVTSYMSPYWCHPTGQAVIKFVMRELIDRGGEDILLQLNGEFGDETTFIEPLDKSQKDTPEWKANVDARNRGRFREHTHLVDRFASSVRRCLLIDPRRGTPNCQIQVPTSGKKPAKTWDHTVLEFVKRIGRATDLYGQDVKFDPFEREMDPDWGSVATDGSVQGSDAQGRYLHDMILRIFWSLVMHAVDYLRKQGPQPVHKACKGIWYYARLVHEQKSKPVPDLEPHLYVHRNYKHYKGLHYGWYYDHHRKVQIVHGAEPLNPPRPQSSGQGGSGGHSDPEGHGRR